MKILLIARGFATEKRPMNGNFETSQAKALKGLGHDVIYASVALRSIRVLNEVGFQYEKVDGIHVYSLNSFIPFSFLPQKLKEWMRKRLLKHLYKIIENKHGRPDLMHSHYLRISYLSLDIKRETNIPWVITEHWSEINKERLPLEVAKMGSEVYKEADLVIAVSNALSRRIKQHFNIDAKTIFNMVPSEFFKIPSVKPNKNTFTFVSVGSLKPIKGHVNLISAFTNAFKGQEVILKIVGGGPQKKELEQMITALNIEKQIILTGPQSSSSVQELLNNANAFALASNSETFGVVFIEAMAKGLPVVTTKCGGPEEFINSINGVLVDVGDVDALSKALLKVKNNIEEYDGKVISEWAWSNFSEESIATRITTEYLKILTKE